MKHLLTLLLLAGSLECFGQIARDSEPAAPLVASVSAAQSPYVRKCGLLLNMCVACSVKSTSTRMSRA